MKCIILAAGKSSRMKMDKVKWSLEIKGRRIIDYILETIRGLEIETIVCIREEYISEANFSYYIQNPDYIDTYGPIASYDFVNDEEYLIINADMPFIKPDTIKGFVKSFKESSRDAGMLVSNNGEGLDGLDIENSRPLFNRFGEFKNIGIYIFKGSFLNKNKDDYMKINNYTIPNLLNGQDDIYIQLADYSYEFLNINTKSDLKKAEGYINLKIIDILKENNNIIDETKVDVDYLSIIKGCTIYPNTKIVNSIIDSSIIKESSIIVNSKIEKNNYIGPFIAIYDSYVDKGNDIGSFVEIKRANIGTNNQIKHHAYLGDIKIGDYNNIGAMMVVSNYDGFNKKRTIIKSHNFIGSFTNLIAPVEIGSNNYIASMTKVNQNITDNQFIKEEHTLTIKENTFNIK